MHIVGHRQRPDPLPTVREWLMTATLIHAWLSEAFAGILEGIYPCVRTGREPRIDALVLGLDSGIVTFLCLSILK